MGGTIPSVVWKDQLSKLFVKPDEQKAIVEHDQSHLIMLTKLFGTKPLTSPQRDLWKRESGEWVLDKDKKVDHVSGSPMRTSKGYSEIDFRQLSEDLFQWAKTETSLRKCRVYHRNLPQPHRRCGPSYSRISWTSPITAPTSASG